MKIAAKKLILMLILAGGNLLTACASTSLTVVSPDRAWEGVLRIAGAPSEQFGKQFFADAFGIPVSELTPRAGNGTVDDLGGFFRNATPQSPFYLSMTYQNTEKNALSLKFSLTSKLPRVLATPLPWCIEVSRARSQLMDLGWTEIFVFEDRRMPSLVKKFVRGPKRHQDTILIWYAPSPSGQDDCLDSLMVSPYAGYSN